MVETRGAGVHAVTAAIAIRVIKAPDRRRNCDKIKQDKLGSIQSDHRIHGIGQIES